ncbi:MAG: NitT/TauT family transport system substrate-binding protein [Actinomycetota bacterium]|nr:NitT/TauT family transport system substrate-binding protein [Actinomycetota bacterium]
MVECAPLYLGLRQGIFRKHGLDLVPSQFPGGSAIMPAVISGQIHIGFSNVISLLAARERGVPLVSVAGAGTSTGDPVKDINAIIVNDGSGLRSPRDLVDKKVAINAWNNLGDTTVRVAVKRDGGDHWRVQFVRVPFQEMPGKLASGAVDAIWVSEPLRSSSLASGGRLLFNNLTETYPKVQVAQFFTTEQVTQQDNALVAAFRDGLKEATHYASSHTNEVFEILDTYVKVSSSVASAIVLPDWTSDLAEESTQALGDAAHEFRTLWKAPDVAGLLGTR